MIRLLDGLHFHTLCEQNSDALETTLFAVEEKFGDILPHMKWLNMGGGHHITREDYDIDRLETLITYAQKKWNLQIYLEPGEAVALNAGFLASHVLDIVQNRDRKIAILDVSAACHMPDVIEMPYTPPLYGAMVGDYSFHDTITTDDLLLFGDMAIYTTCKNNTFNGMPLPDIYMRDVDDTLTPLTHFQYENFKKRLGRESL